jgi:uncharacterized membrane protein
MHTRLDEVFKITIILKGLDSVLEILGGIFFLLITPSAITGWGHDIAHGLFAHQASISKYIIHSSQGIAKSTLFGAIYLLLHGTIKVVLVICLLLNKLWAYPIFIVVIIAFIGYQIYSLVNHLTIGMSLLTVFDVLVVVLTWLEWQKQLGLKEAVASSDVK